MSTITKKLYLTAFRFDSTPPGEVAWSLSASQYAPGQNQAVGCWPHNVTVPLPDDFNPVAAEVAALEQQKVIALRAYQESVAEINERLSKLMAITNEVTA